MFRVTRRGAWGCLFGHVPKARTGASGSGKMPKGKAPLEAEKVQILFRWIFNGAPA